MARKCSECGHYRRGRCRQPTPMWVWVGRFAGHDSQRLPPESDATRCPCFDFKEKADDESPTVGIQVRPAYPQA